MTEGVKEGARWEWTDCPVRAPPYLDVIPRASDRERERIIADRAEHKGRMAAEGRQERTDAERRALWPALPTAQSPARIRKRDGWWLHLPFEKWVPIMGKAEERRLAEPDLKVGPGRS